MHIIILIKFYLIKIQLTAAVAGILLIVYTLLLLDLELSLVERKAPSQELTGVHDDTGQESMYSLGWGLFTSAVLIAMALFMKRILKERSTWAVISLAVDKALALYVDIVFIEDGVSPDNSTAFLHAIMIHAIMIALS